MNRLSRRRFLCSAGAGLVTTLLPGRGREHSYAEKPNILYILADDMGYGDLACQNPTSRIPTPNLDRLAKEGIRFTDAHSPSAVCSPTRYGILTGRYCWRTRLKKGVLRPWARPLIQANRLTVPSLLKDHGYDTACIGKWHLGWSWPTLDGKNSASMGRKGSVKSGCNVDFKSPIVDGPTSRGFDYYFGTAVPNFPPYCFIENERTLGIPKETKPSSMFGSPGPMLAGWDLTQILPGLMKKAVEYIDAKGGRVKRPHFRQTAKKPFFLYLPLTAPHTPIAPTKEFRGKSKAGSYGDFIVQVDHVVGQVLAGLEKNGFAENTLVIFTSDNGSPARDGTKMSGPIRSVEKFGHKPSHTFRGIKADIWDGGHRVPFLARWPGRIKADSTCAEPICHVDLLATCAALIGIELPAQAGEDSFDILPALMGKKGKGTVREALVHHSINGMFALRKGRWKVILGKGSGGWSGKGGKNDPPGQLYDMVLDPAEKHNLYLERPDIVKDLQELLLKYRRSGRSRPV